ncbi:ankyrin repeat-containing domain protein [Xylaria longipes]|nr:ankyrin repeat-containing domain protein [Xylaria longipes]RYC58469.1 hypothetical protein CHU98_g7747 [Xylaria longipes]
MTTQLTFDILQLVSKEILAQAGIEGVFNLSLVSKAVHDFTYPWILRIDGKSLIPQDSRLRTKSLPRSLIFFLESDNAKLVELFLDCLDLSVDAKVGPFSSDTLLDCAIWWHAISVAEFLLRKGANVSSNSPSGPLSRALRRRSVAMIKLVLGHRAKIEPNANNSKLVKWISDNHGDDTFQNTNEIVDTLLQYCSRSDVNQPDKDGFTALHKVVRNTTQNDELNLVKVLVQAGADINALGPEQASYGRYIRRTALNYASINAQPHLIQTLLEMGAKGALAFDFTGSTVVTHFEPSSWRPRAGLSYGPPTNESQVPLIYAAPSPLYDLLYTAHERWMDKDLCWSNAIKWRDAQKANICASAKLLIHHGLVGPQGLLDENHNKLVDIQVVCAQLPVDWPELWALLIEGGVLDIHRRNEFGQTFLNQLVSRCCGNTLVVVPSRKPNLVRALVQAGSDPNTVDHSGMTPLHWSILYGDFDLVKLLVDLGADPAKEVNGATPTHYAFGRPFPRRGPVARKVMSSLRRRLTKILRDSREEPVRIEAFAQFRKCKWHPILSICSDPFMREKHKTLVRDAEQQLFSIMALLSPFAQIATDENGDTPRTIADSVDTGLLKPGDSLVLCPKRLCNRDRSDYLFDSDNSFPRQLLDLDTGKSRPIVLTRVKTTTEDGLVYYSPAQMARFNTVTPSVTPSVTQSTKRPKKKWTTVEL